MLASPSARSQLRVEELMGNADPIQLSIAQDMLESIQSKTVDCFPWVPPQYDRLEVRAALNMSINTILFSIFTFPVVCNAMSLYWCKRFEWECSLNVSLLPYLRYVFIFHVIYNPLMYMLGSHEFRRAFKRLIGKWLPITCAFTF